MIRAVIFDLDDTLYDEAQFVEGGFRAVAAFLARTRGIDGGRAFLTLMGVLGKCGRGKTIDTALKELGIDDTEIVPALVEVYRTHDPALTPYAGCRDLLLKLRSRGYRLGLITDGNVSVQKNKVEALKIDGLLHCTVFSDEYGEDKRKPHPLPYLRALSLLGARPEESVYVGDNPHKDFITAKKLGMHTIRTLTGPYREVRPGGEYEASYRVNAVSELSGILDLIGR
jgi:putative hydrolase of the HAD superfamily